MQVPQIADGYTWVGAEALSTPGPETAEVWQVKASCTRPFFVKALLKTKFKLKAYYDRAPEEIRVWRNREMRIDAAGRAPEQGSSAIAVNTQYGRRAADDAEREAWLHAQYAEWFATVDKLEMDEKQWQQRLVSAADQDLVLGESTRKSFSAYSVDDIGGEGGNAFERHVLFLLGLSGFANEDEQALRSDCVTITPIKKISTQTAAMHELWYWPFNHSAAFFLGLELILMAIFLVPIALWIRAGNLRTSKNHLRRSTRHLVAKTATLHQRKLIFDTFSAYHLHILLKLLPPLRNDHSTGGGKIHSRAASVDGESWDRR
jgi:hypothetical protein